MGKLFVKNLFVYVFLNLVILDHDECVGRPVHHQAMSAFSRILQGHALEARVPLLPPRSLRAKYLLQVASLLTVPLADEVVNQESILILPLKLLLTEAADGF